MLLLAAAALLFGWWLRGAADEPLDPTGLYGDQLEDAH